jgi:hypothetical protein
MIRLFFSTLLALVVLSGCKGSVDKTIGASSVPSGKSVVRPSNTLIRDTIQTTCDDDSRHGVLPNINIGYTITEVGQQITFETEGGFQYPCWPVRVAYEGEMYAGTSPTAEGRHIKGSFECRVYYNGNGTLVPAYQPMELNADFADAFSRGSPIP